ncbi:MAG: DUF4302 domain-containing protein [Paludibacteraceae bacterium]|nr:DUF4302 domain-containing protein [Paludibacteraceae bacterium]
MASLLSACNRDEKSLFDQSASERAQWVLDNAKQVLVNQDSWEMLYFPNRDSCSANIVIKFFKNGQVIASTQHPKITKNKLVTDSSTWVAKNDYGPIISFDTYNEVLHAWANPDPTPDVNPDKKDYTPGDGYLGDYEFLILEANANRVVLKGKKHSAYTILRPMPNVTVEDYFKTCNKQLTNYFGNNAIMTLTQNGKSYYLHNGATGIFTLTAVGEPVPEVDPKTYPICPTLDGFVVCEAFNSADYLSRGVAMEHLFTLSGNKFVGEGGSTISAGDLSTLFMTYISNNKGWKADLTASTGAFVDAASAFTAALVAQSKDSNAKLNSVAITYSGTELIGYYALRMKFEYKKNGQGSKQTITADYKIKVASKNGHIVLTYLEPASDLAATWYNQMPTLVDLINTVMNSFKLSAGDQLNPANNLHLNNDATVIVVSGSSNLK